MKQLCVCLCYIINIAYTDFLSSLGFKQDHKRYVKCLVVNCSVAFITVHKCPMISEGYNAIKPTKRHKSQGGAISSVSYLVVNGRIQSDLRRESRLRDCIDSVTYGNACRGCHDCLLIYKDRVRYGQLHGMDRQCLVLVSTAKLAAYGPESEPARSIPPYFVLPFLLSSSAVNCDVEVEAI